jgi:hypothetical protein
VRFTRDVNFETRTMETEVDVENKDLSIAPGMYANTALGLPSVKNVVTIPIEALVLNAQKQETVYVLDSAIAFTFRSVQVGWRDRSWPKCRRDSARRSGSDRRPGQISRRRRGEPDLLASTPASETVQESGGMIDMKAEATEEVNNAQVSLCKYPYFILMLCLMVIARWHGDRGAHAGRPIPPIDMPVVVVATFYNGMPPEQIEADITNTFERFFTLAANVDHSESRSLTGVSLIKIYFKPGTDPNAALSNVANLAMADLRRLPPGTLPPVVLGMTASTQPVCLVTLKGEGLNETQLKDLAQFQVRNQISNVQGASVPQPYGGTYRQIQIYVDPLKLEARNLSLNDVVRR